MDSGRNVQWPFIASSSATHNPDVFHLTIVPSGNERKKVTCSGASKGRSWWTKAMVDCNKRGDQPMLQI